ncbi:MAG: L-2-amino-thiazoline-4-carboxylic acid hydrolase [Ruminococcus sp.]|nr:L-2-amino-thiazoline-4-carboxylic acid hydrolase [Ruminococcus sp.]
MQDKIEILDGGKKMNIIKHAASEILGNGETEKVWNRAREILSDILSRYKNIPPKEQFHTDLIFPHIAVYKALLESHGEKAMEIMEKGEAFAAKKSAKVYQNIVKLPLGKGMFLKGFAAGCKSGFGSEAGFAHKVYEATANRYRMDVTACPYVKYCKAENCGELTHIFCDNDVYAYGHLDGIAFDRTQTLGTDGEKCDFLLYIKK